MSLCMQRKSIRRYEKTPVNDDMIEALLRSAMQAPSAVNQQPWRFIVIKNKDLLEKLSTVSKGAWPLKEAPVGILTVFKDDFKRKEMVPQDMAAATQNILLEATNQGLGAVWIGVFPREERMANIKDLLNLEKDEPFSLIAIGHPAEDQTVKPRFDSARIQVIE